MQHHSTFIRIVFATACLTLAVIQTGKAQQSNSSFWQEEKKKLDYYNQDFNSFSKTANSKKDNFETAMASDLSNIAANNSDRLFSIDNLIQIAQSAHCEEDKAVSNFYLKYEANYYAQLIGNDTKAVDVSLGYTQIPAVSQTAINLKNDLREIKARLELLAHQ